MTYDMPTTKMHWFRKGQRAHDRGHSADSHDMNPGSQAIDDFRAGWNYNETAKLAELLAKMRAA